MRAEGSSERARGGRRRHAHALQQVRRAGECAGVGAEAAEHGGRAGRRELSGGTGKVSLLSEEAAW